MEKQEKIMYALMVCALVAGLFVTFVATWKPFSFEVGQWCIGIAGSVMCLGICGSIYFAGKD